MKIKSSALPFVLALTLAPAYLFGQGLSISAGAYVNGNAGIISVAGNMASSGTLTLGTGSFTMSGNYTNSGTYTQGTGNVVFNGSNEVLIDNSTGTVFNNVIFNGNGGAGSPAIISSGNFSVSSIGVLNMVNATTLNANGNLTLLSAAASTASVAAIPAVASITGSVNAQRFITGGSGYRGYRLLSSQVYGTSVSSNNVYSINYLENSSYITGTTGIPGGFDKAGNPTLYLYRENLAPSNTSFTSGNFRGINTIGTAPNYGYLIDGDAGTFNIPAGNGLLFFFRGDRSVTTLGAETTTAYIPTNTVLTASGTLNQQQVIVHDWYTPASAYLGWTNGTANTAVRGYNLVGNPYASSIDWETYNTSTTTTGIYANNVGITIYELNPATKNYGTYQKGGVNTNNGSNIIASGQGFFVQTANNTNPQLIFNESAKSATQNSGLVLFMATKNDMGRLKINSNDADQHLRLQLFKDSINNDDIYIGFNPGYKNEFVYDEDAEHKAGAGVLSLASLSRDNVLLAINKLPLPKQQNDTIPLKVYGLTDGVYKLNMTEIKAIPQLFDIWLMDAYKKDSLDIRHNPTYAFDLLRADTNSYGAKRFSLIIRQNQALSVHLLDFAATKATGGAQIVWKTENEQNYTNFTVERSTDNGSTFTILGGFVSNAQATYSLLDKNPAMPADQYRLKLQDLNGTISYSNVVTLMYGHLNNNLVNNTINVYPNPAASTLNLTIIPPFKPSSTATQSLGTVTKTAVSGTSTVYGIKIINNVGSVLKTATTLGQQWQTDVSALTPGTYIIQVINNQNNSLVGRAKFIKM